MAIKKTNVADTSKKAYREIKAEGLIKTEKALVVALMEKIVLPVTSRQLMRITRKERGNITRILYDLQEQNIVAISHTDKCPVTGKTVRFYKLAVSQQPTLFDGQD
jgi:hypothetical protein